MTQYETILQMLWELVTKNAKENEEEEKFSRRVTEP